jgi:arabinogalactan endo-1,4-beta-galactosidase
VAKKLGVPFNPELGLFRSYGDIRCQAPPDFSDYVEIDVPGQWESLTLEQMLPPLRAYGAVVAEMILDTGIDVRIWDIGNEIEFGFAGVAPRPLPGPYDELEGKSDWYIPPDNVDPEIGRMSVAELTRLSADERVAWLEAHIWPYIAPMLAAVADGVRSVDRDARFSTHISGFTAVRPSEALAFYRAMKRGGFFPDELGFSFFPSSAPFPPGRLQAFKETVELVRKELGRPIFIAEYAYPATPMREGTFKDWNHALEHYSLTPGGQADLLRDLVSWGATAGVSGIRPFGPELVVPGWGPMSFFELKGNTATVRPSARAIAEGLACPNANALKIGSSGSDD